jgi:hypothetical protein
MNLINILYAVDRVRHPAGLTARSPTTCIAPVPAGGEQRRYHAEAEAPRSSATPSLPVIATGWLP